MPVVQNHSVAKYFDLPFDEGGLEDWAKDQADQLAGDVTFGTLFCSNEALAYAEEILEIVRIYARVPVMIGCSGVGFVADSREIEGEAGFSVALHHLPETKASVYHVSEGAFGAPNSTEAITMELGKIVDRANSWILFASSESLGSEGWLMNWDAATHGRVTMGGFASSDTRTAQSFLFADGQIHSDGAVALALEGAVTIEPVLSQGCRPVGTPWTVTQVDNNVIHRIGNRPILEVLRDTLEGMSREEQKQARGNIFIGIVRDEYNEEFVVGDFLVRNLAAIDPQTGAVAIATPLRVGQNLQFQIRDAESASINLEEALELKLHEIGRRPIYGACLCDCIGRGLALFGVPDHDVSVVREAIPELSMSGVFCNGEFASQSGRTFLHGYALNLGLFVEK